MGDHYFLVFFGRRRPSKPRNLQITTGDLAFLELEITIFLFFLEATTLETRKTANHNGRSLFSCFWSGKSTFSCFFWRRRPSKPKMCKSQREITIFLLFWSGKSLFSCFFWRRRPSKPENLQITTGDHYFLAFLEWEIHIFFFFAGDDPRNRKSANHSGRSLFSCFFGVGNHFFLVFWAGDDPRNPKICKSQREITIFLLFWMLSPPKKSTENRDFPLQKSKKIVISRCDLQISGFRGSSPAQQARNK